MMKNLLFSVGLLSLLLAGGCAKGGNGIVPPSPSVVVSITSPENTNPGSIYPTQTLTVTATISNSPIKTVTWSLSGPGTLTPITPATDPPTATYIAPATAGVQPIVTATLVGAPTAGNLTLNVIDITTEITPATLSIGAGLTQQFTAIAVPDDAPQTFTWTCKAAGAPCANFQQDAKVSGLAVYTAEDICTGNCVQISAVSTLDPSGCTPTPKFCTVAKVALVTSRVNGTYAFRFSGFDSSGATALAGTFTAGSSGTITSGTVEKLSSTGWAKRSITGSYTPITATDPDSNNAGILTITGPAPNKFQVALDGAGRHQDD